MSHIYTLLNTNLSNHGRGGLSGLSKMEEMGNPRGSYPNQGLWPPIQNNLSPPPNGQCEDSMSHTLYALFHYLYNILTNYVRFNLICKQYTSLSCDIDQALILMIKKAQLQLDVILPSSVQVKFKFSPMEN